MQGTVRAKRWGVETSERWTAQMLTRDLSDWFPGDVTEGGGAEGFRRGLRGVDFGVFWEGSGDAAGRVFVVVRGSGWRWLHESDSLALLRWLDSHEFRPSRVDLAVDFDGLDLRQARELVVSRKVQTRTQRISWHETLRGHGGRTLTVGSRASDRFGRLYDLRGPTRVEVELKRGMADAAYRRIVDGDGTFGSVWGENVRSLIDFPGWAAWVSAVDGATGAVGRRGRPRVVQDDVWT